MSEVNAEGSAAPMEERPGIIEMLKESGPAFLAGGLNIGGASITNAVLLASATGFLFGWVFFLATLAVWVATLACVKISIVTGKNPISVMIQDVHPIIGWANGIAILLVNLVFHTVQVVLGAAVLHTLFPGISQTIWGFIFVVLVAAFVLTPRRSTLLETVLKVLIYGLTVAFVLSLFVVPIDWGQVGTMFRFTLPTDAGAVLLFTAVLGSALAINVPTIQGYGSVTRTWGVKNFRVFRFETALTNLLLLFSSLAVMIVVGSTLFAEGVEVTSAVQAAQALEPLAGDFAAILFSVALFAAVFTTAGVQTLVSGYIVSDLAGWKPEIKDVKFKVVQIVMLLVALSVPLFNLNPFEWVAWGAAFNSTFMPIGIATWWYLINKTSLLGKYRANPLMNVGLAVAMLIAVTAAVRFWYVTLT